MPAALCGSIIGKGGATIRSFSEDSKAQIGLSPQVPEPWDVLCSCLVELREELSCVCEAGSWLLRFWVLFEDASTGWPALMGHVTASY